MLQSYGILPHSKTLILYIRFFLILKVIKKIDFARKDEFFKKILNIKN